MLCFQWPFFANGHMYDRSETQQRSYAPWRGPGGSDSSERDVDTVIVVDFLLKVKSCGTSQIIVVRRGRTKNEMLEVDCIVMKKKRGLRETYEKEY